MIDDETSFIKAMTIVSSISFKHSANGLKDVLHKERYYYPYEDFTAQDLNEAYDYLESINYHNYCVIVDIERRHLGITSDFSCLDLINVMSVVINQHSMVRSMGSTNMVIRNLVNEAIES